MTTAGCSPTPATFRHFSIRPPRPLWIGMAAAALAVGYVAVRVGVPIYKQHSAIQHIRRLGGEVRVHTNDPQWLFDRLPDALSEGFGRVVVVDLGIPTVTDSDLRQLQSLPDVVSLSICKSRVTDTGLKSFATLTRLESVWAARTNITSEAIERLQVTAPHIRVLTFHGTMEPFYPVAPD